MRWPLTGWLVGELDQNPAGLVLLATKQLGRHSHHHPKSIQSTKSSPPVRHQASRRVASATADGPAHPTWAGFQPFPGHDQQPTRHTAKARASAHLFAAHVRFQPASVPLLPQASQRRARRWWTARSSWLVPIQFAPKALPKFLEIRPSPPPSPRAPPFSLCCRPCLVSYFRFPAVLVRVVGLPPISCFLSSFALQQPPSPTNPNADV